MPILSIIITFTQEKGLYWLDWFLWVFKSIIRAIKVTISDLNKEEEGNNRSSNKQARVIIATSIIVTCNNNSSINNSDN